MSGTVRSVVRASGLSARTDVATEVFSFLLPHGLGDIRVSGFQFRNGMVSVFVAPAFEVGVMTRDGPGANAPALIGYSDDSGRSFRPPLKKTVFRQKTGVFVGVGFECDANDAFKRVNDVVTTADYVGPLAHLCYESGYCWLKWYAIHHWLGLVEALGPFPDLGKLVVPSKERLHTRDVVQLELAGDCYHVAYVGTGAAYAPKITVPIGDFGGHGHDMSKMPVGSNARGMCDVCGFEVLLDGHEDRCRVPGQSSQPTHDKLKCWLGDAAHKLDVRRIVSYFDVPPKERTILADLYCAGSGQMAYLRAVCGDDYVASQSERVWANAFEEQYDSSREFVKAYKLWLRSELQRTYKQIPKPCKHAPLSRSTRLQQFGSWMSLTVCVVIFMIGWVCVLDWFSGGWH